MMKTASELPVKTFKNADEWERWLEKNHATATGLWIRFAKKGSGAASVSRDEVLAVALCYGWIDGQAKSESDEFWQQRFTPRSKRSIWSKINRESALRLMESGRMRPSGLAEVERARADGRWDAAYDSPKTASVPPDLQAALEQNANALAFFNTLDSRNRYAILHRIQTVKKAETRAKRIDQFVDMLSRREKLYS